MKKTTWVALLPVLLTGCQTVGQWADDVGEHMPVIGERCHHWECFSSSGQAQSDMNQQYQQPQYQQYQQDEESQQEPAEQQYYYPQ